MSIDKNHQLVMWKYRMLASMQYVSTNSVDYTFKYRLQRA
jgi:hypothetical protein